MIENVPAQYTIIVLGQEISASKCTIQKNHIYQYDGCKALAPVKPHQFVVQVGWGDMPSDSTEALGNKVTSAPVSKSNSTSETVVPASGFRSVTRAAGAGGSKSDAS